MIKVRKWTKECQKLRDVIYELPLDFWHYTRKLFLAKATNMFIAIESSDVKLQIF
jgi:hypothetical protein